VCAAQAWNDAFGEWASGTPSTSWTL
jgi:hypothetical protein